MIPLAINVDTRERSLGASKHSPTIQFPLVLAKVCAGDGNEHVGGRQTPANYRGSVCAQRVQGGPIIPSLGRKGDLNGTSRFVRYRTHWVHSA